MNKQQKHFYSVSEFAQILGICSRTMRTLLKNNSVKAVRLGGKYFIPKIELERLTNSEEINAGMVTDK